MPRILIADDSEVIRRMVQFALGRDGLQVDTVSNGAEAIERMLSDPPDAALLDILMPLMDGLEVLRRMAAEPALAHIPVMMLTSSSLAENVQEALRNGARDFVVKPFDADELWARVQRLLASPQDAAPASAKGQLPVAPDTRLVRRIVIVDDQEIVREAAREMLEDRFEVSVAGSGPGALALAVRLRPDLMLLELTAHRMGGDKALDRLRALQDMHHTRYVAIADGRAEVRVPDGFHGVVRKPFARAELLATVGQLLELGGLFSFAVDGDATIFRLHPRRLSSGETELEEAAARVWDKGELEELHAAVDAACAQMLTADRSWFVVDAMPLSGLPEYLGAPFATAARLALKRARECRFHCRLVVPLPLQRYFHPLRDEPPIELYASVQALRVDLRREIELGDSLPGRS